MTTAIRNISVRKEAEQQLAEVEGRYRGLLEAAPDAMVVVNQAGDIVLLNVQAEKQFGYRRDELVGQQVTNIIPHGFAERLVADDLRSASDALAQQIGTGIELSGLRKDKSEFPIEIMLSPLDSPEGILVTAAIRNISVRKEAEQQLAEVEGRYRGLLEAAPDAMVVVNQAGDIVLLNVQAEKQFGYRRDELVGQQVTNIIPHGFAERLVADDLRSASDALAQQIGTGIELSGLRKDKSEFPIEIMLSPLDSPEGILVTAAIRNISVRKEAERHLAGLLADLRASDTERGRLLDHVVVAQEHERERIANEIHDDPIQKMTAAQLCLGTMMRSFEPSSPHRATLLLLQDAVGSSIKRLRSMLLELRPRELDTGNLLAAVRDYLENVRQYGDETVYVLDADMEIEPSSSESTITYRLVQEAVANARKHAQATTVRVRIKTRRGRLSLRVEDDGVGIGGQAFAAPLPGHMGFSSMRQRAEMAGGAVEISSPPGRGTSVVAWIPLGPPAEQEGRDSSERQPDDARD
ncbi:MAG: PAS domain-containing sensor histidine kinase [Actinomycetota bacterium]